MSLLIYSGGMDSTTLLYDIVPSLAVTFNYGQKHDKEVEFAKENCKDLKVKHLIFDALSIFKQFDSHLLKGSDEIPDGHYTDEVMKKTVVPFRNGIFLSIAAGLAESQGLKEIYIANHAGDHPIYRDCTFKFIESLSLSVFLGTDRGIRLRAPYTKCTKREVAEIGKRLGVDYSKTWSCYKGKEKHCGKCGTCVERKEALEGFDPTEYEE